jgi:Transposase IS66 family
MADHVGACAATLLPIYELIKSHVFAAERIHGDDTSVPVLAKMKTRTGRLWTVSVRRTTPPSLPSNVRTCTVTGKLTGTHVDGYGSGWS